MQLHLKFGRKEMFEFIISILVIVPLLCMVWESTLMISERKERYRAGTHDYYDNLIEKDSE
jgi:hypothetical protein